jgi:hypothetical protein
MTILEKNKNKNKKKNIWGKLKLDYQPAQYWKNKFDKYNFFKIYMGKYCSKTKTMQGKHCSNPYYFFLKKKL